MQVSKFYNALCVHHDVGDYAGQSRENGQLAV